MEVHYDFTLSSSALQHPTFQLEWKILRLSRHCPNNSSRFLERQKMAESRTLSVGGIGGQWTPGIPKRFFLFFVELVNFDVA